LRELKERIQSQEEKLKEGSARIEEINENLLIKQD